MKFNEGQIVLVLNPITERKKTVKNLKAIVVDNDFDGTGRYILSFFNDKYNDCKWRGKDCFGYLFHHEELIYANINKRV